MFLVSRVFLDDKDYLKAQRNELMATLHSKNDARVKVPLLEVAKDSSQVAEKRTYEDLEQVNNFFIVSYLIANDSYFFNKRKITNFIPKLEFWNKMLKRPNLN